MPRCDLNSFRPIADVFLRRAAVGPSSNERDRSITGPHRRRIALLGPPRSFAEHLCDRLAWCDLKIEPQEAKRDQVQERLLKGHRTFTRDALCAPTRGDELAIQSASCRISRADASDNEKWSWKIKWTRSLRDFPEGSRVISSDGSHAISIAGATGASATLITPPSPRLQASPSSAGRCRR